MKPGSQGRPGRGGAAPAAAAGGPELDARRAQRLRTGAALRAVRTPLQVVEVTDAAFATAAQALAAAEAREPRQAAPACREGCTWCCHQRVGASAAEVLRAVRYLRETLPAEEVKAVRARAAEVVARRAALPPGARGKAVLPCPLLADGRCLAYPVRPLTCRGFNSSDAERCREALAPGGRRDVPSYGPQQRFYTFVLDGLRAGLAEARLDGELLELAAALVAALDDPAAEARWLAGEGVFRGARLG
jgi:Fe-S-cluster containining protein